MSVVLAAMVSAAVLATTHNLPYSLKVFTLFTTPKKLEWSGFCFCRCLCENKTKVQADLQVPACFCLHPQPE